MSTETLERPTETYIPLDVTGLNLYQRLVAVKKAIGKVGKTANAPAEMGGFRYVPWEGVADRVGDLFADHGIVALSSISEYEVDQTADKVGSKQKTNYRTTVKLVLTLINADNPEENHELTWFGVGDDTSDKGLQKAATNGTKYLLMKVLMLGGMGGADDSDHTSVDGDSESTPAPIYGPCPRGVCGGTVQRKTAKKTGKDYACCSTGRFRDGKASGCEWKDWEPNFESYEQRALQPAVGAASMEEGEKVYGLADQCPYCFEKGIAARFGGTRERLVCNGPEPHGSDGLAADIPF